MLALCFFFISIMIDSCSFQVDHLKRDGLEHKIERNLVNSAAAHPDGHESINPMHASDPRADSSPAPSSELRSRSNYTGLNNAVAPNDSNI